MSISMRTWKVLWVEMLMIDYERVCTVHLRSGCKSSGVLLSVLYKAADLSPRHNHVPALEYTPLGIVGTEIHADLCTTYL